MITVIVLILAIVAYMYIYKRDKMHALLDGLKGITSRDETSPSPSHGPR